MAPSDLIPLAGGESQFRVAYINPLDGSRRVFIGGVDRATAVAVMSKWGNQNEGEFYMGPGMAIEPCDGTPDGNVITQAEAT
jgi:hypothetical protein